eukprot:6060123-Pleurochrysis_carterae.AAC.3
MHHSARQLRTVISASEMQARFGAGGGGGRRERRRGRGGRRRRRWCRRGRVDVQVGQAPDHHRQVKECHPTDENKDDFQPEADVVARRFARRASLAAKVARRIGGDILRERP